MTDTKDTKTRSATKSVIWRVVGVIVLALITWFYTLNLITVGLVTVLHHTIFLLVYYFHERLWLRVKRFKNLTHRGFAKMFTYETLCGNVILGLITYFVTGSLVSMTQITFTYIGIKHVIYVFNEFLWKKIKWGRI